MPLNPETLTFDLESDVRVVTCDVGYLCVNFSLSRPLCSRHRSDVRDRQTDVRQTSDSIIAQCPRLLGAGHNNAIYNAQIPKGYKCASDGRF